MGKINQNKKKAIENLNLFYQDIRQSSSVGRHLTQEEAEKEELAIRISQRYGEIRWKDGEKDAVKRIQGEALKEKNDPGAFIFPIRLEGKVNENAMADTGSDMNTMPYRIYEQLGRDDLKNEDRGITMIDHTQAEVMGKLSNVLCQVGVTTLIAEFLILDILIDRDSPIVVGRGFLRTMGCMINTSDRIFLTFDVFCHQTFRAARSDYMRNKESDSDDERSILQEHTTEKPDHHDPNAQDTKLRKNYCFHKFTMSFCYGKDAPEMLSLGCDGEIDDMLRIRVREAESEEEIFTSVAWIRAFNINEPIYAEFCHEFYSTYEFDEVCVDDELQSKKIIRFRLGGRAHNLTLLEFARRLGLYQAVELEEDGFNVYFEGGLRSDDNFNATNYWLSIIREENLSLSKSHTSTYSLCQRTPGYDKVQKNDLWLLSMFDARHQNGYTNVAWVIAKWMKKKGAGTQKESQFCCGQFILKLARKCRVLTKDVMRNLSALIYCRDLDTTTLRDLIDSDGKLIPEDPQPGVPRVGIPRPPRASMQDLYDRMGRMEICQDAIERMEYRQSYH
ncbi:retrotransposon ORF1 [Tanacetum coccineum]